MAPFGNSFDRNSLNRAADIPGTANTTEEGPHLSRSTADHESSPIADHRAYDRAKNNSIVMERGSAKNLFLGGSAAKVTKAQGSNIDDLSQREKASIRPSSDLLGINFRSSIK